MGKITIEVNDNIHDMMKILEEKGYGAIQEFIREGLNLRILKMYNDMIKAEERTEELKKQGKLDVEK